MGGLRPAPSIDGARFREVIGHFTTGVAVVTAHHAGIDYGMSASSVTSVSADPPTLLVCLNALTATHDAVSASGVFCINVLAQEHDDLALRFAQPRTKDKFASVSIARGIGAVPVLVDALASLQCRVNSVVEAGTHEIIMGRVERAHARDGAPLAYFRGGFGRTELASHASAKARLRRFLYASPPPEELLHLDCLAAELNLTISDVRSAVRALEADGVVVRRDDDHAFLAPIDGKSYEEAFDARGAIEFGVVEQTVGNATPEQLRRLRALMEATTGLIARGRFTDVAAYVEANAALHEFLISFSGSDLLRDAYQRLELPLLMNRLFAGYNLADDGLIEDHRVLVEAYEDGNLGRARSVVRAHLERSKATNRAAIDALGGVG